MEDTYEIVIEDITGLLPIVGMAMLWCTASYL